MLYNRGGFVLNIFLTLRIVKILYTAFSICNHLAQTWTIEKWEEKQSTSHTRATQTHTYLHISKQSHVKKHSQLIQVSKSSAHTKSSMTLVHNIRSLAQSLVWSFTHMLRRKTLLKYVYILLESERELVRIDLDHSNSNKNRFHSNSICHWQRQHCFFVVRSCAFNLNRLYHFYFNILEMIFQHFSSTCPIFWFSQKSFDHIVTFDFVNVTWRYFPVWRCFHKNHNKIMDTISIE